MLSKKSQERLAKILLKKPLTKADVDMSLNLYSDFKNTYAEVELYLGIEDLKTAETKFMEIIKDFNGLVACENTFMNIVNAKSKLYSQQAESFKVGEKLEDYKGKNLSVAEIEFATFADDLNDYSAIQLYLNNGHTKVAAGKLFDHFKTNGIQFNDLVFYKAISDKIKGSSVPSFSNPAPILPPILPSASSLFESSMPALEPYSAPSVSAVKNNAYQEDVVMEDAAHNAEPTTASSATAQAQASSASQNGPVISSLSSSSKEPIVKSEPAAVQTAASSIIAAPIQKVSSSRVPIPKKNNAQPSLRPNIPSLNIDFSTSGLVSLQPLSAAHTQNGSQSIFSLQPHSAAAASNKAPSSINVRTASKSDSGISLTRPPSLPTTPVMSSRTSSAAAHTPRNNEMFSPRSAAAASDKAPSSINVRTASKSDSGTSLTRPPSLPTTPVMSSRMSSAAAHTPRNNEMFSPRSAAAARAQHRSNNLGNIEEDSEYLPRTPHTPVNLTSRHFEYATLIANATTLYNSNNFKASLEAVFKALKIRPDSKDTFEIIGKLYNYNSTQESRRDLIIQLKDFIKSNDRENNLHALRHQIAILIKSFNKSYPEEMMETPASDIDSDDQHNLKAKGSYLSIATQNISTNPESAVNALIMVLAIDPTYDAAHDYLIEIYNENGREIKDYVIKKFNTLESEIESNPAIAEAVKANYNFTLQRFTNAQQQNAKLEPNYYLHSREVRKKLDPTDKINFKEKAGNYIKRKNFFKAVENYSKSLENIASDGKTYLQLAKIYCNKEFKEESKSHDDHLNAALKCLVKAIYFSNSRVLGEAIEQSKDFLQSNPSYKKKFILSLKNFKKSLVSPVKDFCNEIERNSEVSESNHMELSSAAAAAAPRSVFSNAPESNSAKDKSLGPTPMDVQPTLALHNNAPLFASPMRTHPSQHGPIFNASNMQSRNPLASSAGSLWVTTELSAPQNSSKAAAAEEKTNSLENNKRGPEDPRILEQASKRQMVELGKYVRKVTNEPKGNQADSTLQKK